MASSLHLHFLNPGPMTPGHEEVACVSCHLASPGTARQQIQANVAYLLGWRKTSVAFGFQAPTLAACQGCHSRPDDAHPLHRASEPRFADALKTVAANTCLGCHQEHRGVRVSSGGEFCSSCHDDLNVRNDPLNVAHRTLAAEQLWSTCLGCHDYHGNHARTVQQNLADAYDVKAIRSYLANGPDPYASVKRHPAREKP
jgi:hypothetical protein